MTSKSKNALRGYETEIEKCREESNWKKAVDLAQQLKARSPHHESLAHFLIGEGKLEIYLDEWAPTKDNVERAQRELSEARGYLTLATDEQGKKAGVALDAHLLLGKLNYACGAYEDTLKNYKMAELSSLTEKELPVRSLRIVAESFAIKGLCLEQTEVQGSSSRFKQAEKEMETIHCYELATDLTLLYLQRANPSAGAGPTLETAIQRVPLLHMRAGRLNAAVDRYRELLRAEETPSMQSLRLTFTRQLAEVLLRGVTGELYEPPEKSPTSLASTMSRRKDNSEGPWKPKKYSRLNQFVPACIQEEVILVLVLGEALAARGAVLSQSAEFAAVRDHSVRHAAAMCDLLALCASAPRLTSTLLECLDRGMKFSFGRGHIWRQRALASAAGLHCSNSYNSGLSRPSAPSSGSMNQALSVCARAAILCPDDVSIRLLQADVCYKANWIEEGKKHAKEALAAEERLEGPLLARCMLYVGIGYQMKAQKSNARIDKDRHNDKSIKYLLRAVQMDDNDYLAFYYLALQYMYLGMLNEAMEATRACLQLQAECGGALRLAGALWSCGAAGARRPRGLHAARLARHHHPAAAWAAADLLQHTARHQPETALTLGKQLLQMLTAAEAEAEAEAEHDHLDALSDSQHDDTHSIRDAASIRAESVGARRVERALSEGASSMCVATKRAPFTEPKAMAWLLLAEICLRLDRVSAAAGCVSEAAALTPFSHLVLYTRGLVHAASAEWEEARQCFQNALAIHPTHIDSLIQLGTAYYHLGWLRLAEKYLRSAVSLEPGKSSGWLCLSRVLLSLSEPAAAADAAAAALGRADTEPRHVPRFV